MIIARAAQSRKFLAREPQVVRPLTVERRTRFEVTTVIPANLPCSQPRFGEVLSLKVRLAQNGEIWYYRLSLKQGGAVRTKTLWIKAEYLQHILTGRKTVEVRVGYRNITCLQVGD